MNELLLLSNKKKSVIIPETENIILISNFDTLPPRNDITNESMTIFGSASKFSLVENYKFPPFAMMSSGGSGDVNSNFYSGTHTKDITANTDFTIEGWWCFQETVSAVGSQAYFMGLNENLNNGYYGIRISGSAYSKNLAVALNSTTVISKQINFPAVALGGTIGHLALTREGSVVRIFINGELIISDIFTQAIYGTVKNFRFGLINNAYRPYTITDSVRITIGQSLYNENFEVPMVPFQISE